MIELQLLNKVLAEKSLNILFMNNITDDHFIQYKEEYEFIINHYNNYGNIPDVETVVQKFEDFNVLQVQESDKYLIENLQEAHLYSKLVPVLYKVQEILQTDSKEAIDYLLPNVEQLVKLGAFSAGKSWKETGQERLADVIRRRTIEGILGIPSGMAELDEYTHGWLDGEDLVTIVGRTNEGKSWILAYYLANALLKGKKVLLYSGEMGHDMTGKRVDTLVCNVTNLGMLNGKMTDQDFKIYEQHIKDIKTMVGDLIIVTPKDLGGKRLTQHTLKGLIEQHEPDMVGIDQISLMDDSRAQKGDPNRIRLSNVSEDLFKLSEDYGIPILVDAQANRDASKKKEQDKAPETSEIAESDAIAQNSSRVISIKQTGAGLKVALKKNRYGINNVEFLYYWDIDKGIFKYIPTSENPQSQEATEERNEFNDGTDVF